VSSRAFKASTAFDEARRVARRARERRADPAHELAGPMSSIDFGGTF